jgi:SAM-dependent methyltransferase
LSAARERGGFVRGAAKRLPDPVRRWIRRRFLIPRPHPRWGNLRRTRPFSQNFGIDRGTPVDRIYVARFLEAHRTDIRGATLEMGDAGYTRAFGGDAVTSSDVLDLDPQTPGVTIAGDLTDPGTLRGKAFDCFILQQTLQYISDLERALANAYGALAPEGVLLITVPTVSMIELRWPDLWRFTPDGLRNSLARSIPEADVEVVSYGNVLTAISFLMGLAAEELRSSDFDSLDSGYPVVTCARVQKPPGTGGAQRASGPLP